MEIVTFANRGTEDCRRVAEWLREMMPDANIISVCLQGDPYVDIEAVEAINSSYGLNLFLIPFDASFISSKNLNVELAWQFERHLKALQFQRSRVVYTPKDNLYEYVVISLRGTDKNKELVSILQGYLDQHSFDINEKLEGKSFVVYPLEHLTSDTDPITFIPVDEV